MPIRNPNTYRSARRNSAKRDKTAWTERLEGSKYKDLLPEPKRVAPRVRNKGGDFKSEIRAKHKRIEAANKLAEQLRAEHAELVRELSVRDEGAVGDGHTDDTAAIQSTLDKAYGEGV